MEKMPFYSGNCAKAKATIIIGQEWENLVIIKMNFFKTEDQLNK